MKYTTNLILEDFSIVKKAYLAVKLLFSREQIISVISDLQLISEMIETKDAFSHDELINNIKSNADNAVNKMKWLVN